MTYNVFSGTLNPT